MKKIIYTCDAPGCTREVRIDADERDVKAVKGWSEISLSVTGIYGGDPDFWMPERSPPPTAGAPPARATREVHACSLPCAKKLVETFAKRLA